MSACMLARPITHQHARTYDVVVPSTTYMLRPEGANPTRPTYTTNSAQPMRARLTRFRSRMLGPCVTVVSANMSIKRVMSAALSGHLMPDRSTGSYSPLISRINTYECRGHCQQTISDDRNDNDSARAHFVT